MDSKNVDDILENYKKFSEILFGRLINLENELHREDNELYNFYNEKRYTVRPLIDVGDVVPRNEISKNFSSIDLEDEEIENELNRTVEIDSDNLSEYIQNFLKKYIEKK